MASVGHLSDTPATDPLVMLVRQLLIGATDELSPSALAAYVAGWTAALDLISRTDLLVPGAEPAVHDVIAAAIERIRFAQGLALDDEPGDLDG